MNELAVNPPSPSRIPQLPKIKGPDLGGLKNTVSGVVSGATEKAGVVGQRTRETIQTIGGKTGEVVTGAKSGITIKAGELSQGVVAKAGDARVALGQAAGFTKEKGGIVAGKTIEMIGQAGEIYQAVMTGREAMRDPQKVGAYVQTLQNLVEDPKSQDPRVKLETIMADPIGKAVMAEFIIQYGSKVLIAVPQLAKFLASSSIPGAAFVLPVGEYALSRLISFQGSAKEGEKKLADQCLESTAAVLAGKRPGDPLGHSLNPNNFSVDAVASASPVLGPVLKLGLKHFSSRQNKQNTS